MRPPHMPLALNEARPAAERIYGIRVATTLAAMLVEESGAPLRAASAKAIRVEGSESEGARGHEKASGEVTRLTPLMDVGIIVIIAG